MAMPAKRRPRRGEIWFVKLHVDPPDKGLRPVLIVSVDARNQHDRADTVLAIPLTTSIHREAPTHIFLTSAETGLSSDSAACAENVTMIRRDHLVAPRSLLRQIGSARICQIGHAIQIAIGCAT